MDSFGAYVGTGLGVAKFVIAKLKVVELWAWARAGELRIEKLASFNDTVLALLSNIISTLLLSLLSPVKLANLNVADFSTEQQEEFFWQDVIANYRWSVAS